MAPRRNLRKRRSRPRRGGKRRGNANSTANMAKDNHACLSTTIDNFVDTTTLYNFEHKMSTSTRASALAAQYQFYKIDYVEVRVKPLFDTYMSTDISGVKMTTPQMYFYISKSQNSPTNVSQFKLMGVNPRAFSKDGNFVYRYKPAVQLPGYGDASILGLIKKTSPWLSCSTGTNDFDIDTTPHYGACFIIEDVPFSGASRTYRVGSVEVETHFKFKNPILATPATEQNITPATILTV